MAEAFASGSHELQAPVMSMPRLNVDDEWFDDPRRTALGELIGPTIADGVALRMWRLAQTYYRVGLLVPAGLFDCAPYAKEFEQVGLASREPDGVYVKGRRDRFRWIKNRSEAGAKGGSKGKKEKKDTNAPSKQNEANESKAMQVQASSSPSSSSKKNSLVDPSESTLLWRHYETGIRAKGLEPVHEGAKTNRLLKTLIDDHGVEKAHTLITTYLNDPDEFVKAQAWSLGLLFSQRQKFLNRIGGTSQFGPVPLSQVRPI